MQPTSHLEALRAELAALVEGRSVVIMGVGNELRGDDGVGVILAGRLEGRIPQRIFVTFDLPEDYAVKVADLRPDVVLVLDAADFGDEPGAARLIRAQDIPPTPGVTHRPSLEMLARFLELDAGAQTWVLGVQPDLTRVGLGEEMSAPVVRALDALDALLVDVLGAR
jgi:hydrogenase 3 maturation protease